MTALDATERVDFREDQRRPAHNEQQFRSCLALHKKTASSLFSQSVRPKAVSVSIVHRSPQII